MYAPTFAVAGSLRMPGSYAGAVKRTCSSESTTKPAGYGPMAMPVITDRFEPVTVTTSPPAVVALPCTSYDVITGGWLISATCFLLLVTGDGHRLLARESCAPDRVSAGEAAGLRMPQHCEATFGDCRLAGG